MISLTADELHSRAQRMCSRLNEAEMAAEVSPGVSVIGGGPRPINLYRRSSWHFRFRKWSAGRRRLRAGDPAVVARVEDDRLILDLKNVYSRTRKRKLADALMRARDSFRQRRNADHFAFVDERAALERPVQFPSLPAC